MTPYHRYIIADGQTTTLDELHDEVRALDQSVSFDHEVVMYRGDDCGVLIDVTERGNPVFDGDLEVVSQRLESDNSMHDRIRSLLDAAQCMVTTQVLHDANDSVIQTIWSALQTYCPGVLVMEDYASTIRYYE